MGKGLSERELRKSFHAGEVAREEFWVQAGERMTWPGDHRGPSCERLGPVPGKQGGVCSGTGEMEGEFELYLMSQNFSKCGSQTIPLQWYHQGCFSKMQILWSNLRKLGG